jgi:hypothetical protein
MFKRAKAILRRAQLWVGSWRLGSKAFSKHSDLAFGLDGDLGFATLTHVGEGDPGSSGQFVVLPAALTSSSLAGCGSASSSTVVSFASVLAVGLDLAVSVLPTCSDLDVGGPMPVASALERSAKWGHPLPSSFEASSELLELGAIWKSAKGGFD